MTGVYMYDAGFPGKLHYSCDIIKKYRMPVLTSRHPFFLLKSQFYYLLCSFMSLYYLDV